MPYGFESRSYNDDGSVMVLPRPSNGVPSSQTEVTGDWAYDRQSGCSYIEFVGARCPSSSRPGDWGRMTSDGALCVTQEVSPASGDYVHQSIRYRNDGAMYVQFNGTANSASDQRTRLGRLTRTGALYLDAISFFLDFGDLGAGVVDITPKLGNVAGTFTRATAAASKLSTGLWKLDVASGSPRYTYTGFDTTVTTDGGYFAEGARTNSALQARDLTNASWTKSNLTTAKTSIGIDGGVNSCTRCTASAGNGTALQAVTLASAAKAFGVWVKRITGTGEIDVTLDNGSTWTNVTSSINAVTFTLVQATQTLANPTVGIRVVTSGDAVDVDVAQLEDGAAFVSSPIPTTVAAVTRNADVLTYPTSPWLSATAGTFFVAGRNGVFSGTQQIYSVNDGTTNEIIAAVQRAADSLTINHVAQDGGVGQVAMAISTTADNAAIKDAMAYATNDYAAALNGGTVSTDTSATLATVTEIDVGHRNGSLQYFGTISRTAYFARRLADQQLQKITA